MAEIAGLRLALAHQRGAGEPAHSDAAPRTHLCDAYAASHCISAVIASSFASFYRRDPRCIWTTRVGKMMTRSFLVLHEARMRRQSILSWTDRAACLRH